MLNREKTYIEENKMKSYGILNYHVLDGMADCVRVVDEDGIIIYANKTMKKVFGQDIMGKNCYEIHGRKTPCKVCITDKSIETGAVVQKEERINGRYYSIKSSPVKNLEGKIFAAVEVFRDMTRERRLEKELLEKNKKMRKDLMFAKKIQQKILPDKDGIKDFKLDYIYKPSEMLSGDMFDVFKIDDENVGVYISDVVGHGVSASMMTMFIRQTMRFIKDEILSPADALSELHKRFKTLGLEVDNYFTIFYGVFNKKTYDFKYSNAGHNCIPIRYDEKDIDFLKIKGYPVSPFFKDASYQEGQIKLKKKDKILLYTDGIIEARGKMGEEFGVEGILETIKSKNEDILKDIDENMIKYILGEQKDDFALVLIEIY